MRATKLIGGRPARLALISLRCRALSPAPHALSLCPLPLPLPQLCGGDLAALSKEVRGVPDPDISRAAGGGLQQEETEESEEGPGASGGEAPGGSPAGGGGGGDPSQLHRTQQARWQQHRRRTRLPEPDYRDGAGI